MTRKKRTIIIVIIVAVCAIAALFARAWFYVADKVSRPDSYREYITKTVSEKLNRSLSYEAGTASLTLLGGLSFQFTNLAIREKDDSSDLLRVDKALVRVNIFPLLRNRLVFGEVVLDHPRVSLKRDSSGVLNIDDLLTRKDDEKAPRFRKIIIERGSVVFVDQAAGSGSIRTALENINGRMNALFWTSRYRFRIKTSVIENKNKAELALDGFFSFAPSDKPFYESKVRTSVYLKGMDLSHYGSYLKKYTSVELVSGRLNAELFFSGRFSDFKSKGKVEVKNASLCYPGVLTGYVHPRSLQLNYSLKRNRKRLHLDVAHLAIDHFNAKGSFNMDDLDKKDPLLKASAMTTLFSMKAVKPYIPWGIIHEDVGSFIQEHIKDGKFRLVEGKLTGRLSRIADFNSKESIDVLSITAEVDKGVFEAGGSAPLFHDISGVMELKKRQFSLKNMKGYFGRSPCTLEGNISDFARPEPNIYTAYMKVQPVRDEVVWLLGEEDFRDMNFQGTSLVVLSGKGPDDNFRVNARWDLTDAAYAFSNVLEKPRMKQNQVTAVMVIDDEALNFTSFRYSLPPVDITGTMMFRYSGESPASFNIQSRAFNLREAVPMAPMLKKYDPAGAGRISVSGRGNLSEPSSLRWNGRISLTNASIAFSDRIGRMKGLSGSIFFKDRSMETSLFKTQIGRSKIQGSFKIDDLNDSTLNCRFSTDLLRTADLGLQSPKGELNLHDVKGQISIEDNLIHVESLYFGVGHSNFKLSGDISDFDLPKITLELNSMYVDSDDFSRLMSLSYPSKEKNEKSTMELNAVLLMDAGTFGDVPFQKLYAGLKLKNRVLDVEALEAGLFDGKFKVKGKVNLSSDGRNHYDTDISVERVSLEKLQNYLKIGDRTITGNLSLAGHISAAGDHEEELKRTAAGTFTVRAEKGVLKKFSVLSKIFSLLNVFQLAKLQLPDMARGGMPYSAITFHAALKDGVIFSEDFFIDGNAMQISGSGRVDILQKKLDCIAGVHPLQTLDVIASRIPIAGWIITDERGKLITAHFKIDGTWDDPQVTTMTAKSIGKGTLDIFRRIFRLPQKLITDTGDVILGH